VDIDAIEAQMKMSALDGLRGYAQDHYGVVRQENRTEYVGEERARGVNVLREPGWNKGSSPPLSSPALKEKNGLHGSGSRRASGASWTRSLGAHSVLSFMGASPQTPGLAALDYYSGRSDIFSIVEI
jgi:hypothetical protein